MKIYLQVHAISSVQQAVAAIIVMDEPLLIVQKLANDQRESKKHARLQSV